MAVKPHVFRSSLWTDPKVVMASHKNCVSETFEFSNSGAENLIRCGLTERNDLEVNTNRHTMVNCSQLNLVNSK